MRKHLFLGLILLINLAWAGEVYQDANNRSVYLLVGSNYDKSEISSLTCQDYLSAYSDNDDAQDIIQDWMTAKGASSALFCILKSEKGTIYADPTDIDYVIEGVSYGVDYSEIEMVQGDLGRVREGSSIAFLIAMPGRTLEALYYLEDSVKNVSLSHCYKCTR